MSITLPALGVETDRRCTRTNHPMLEARRFVLRQMPTSAAALEGGTFTISAEMRAPGRGVRWRVICRWREGEPVEVALDRASRAWERLSKECR